MMSLHSRANRADGLFVFPAPIGHFGMAGRAMATEPLNFSYRIASNFITSAQAINVILDTYARKEVRNLL
jgi:hypothetical protein